MNVKKILWLVFLMGLPFTVNAQTPIRIPAVLETLKITPLTHDVFHWLNTTHLTQGEFLRFLGERIPQDDLPEVMGDLIWVSFVQDPSSTLSMQQKLVVLQSVSPHTLELVRSFADLKNLEGRETESLDLSSFLELDFQAPLPKGGLKTNLEIMLTLKMIQSLLLENSFILPSVKTQVLRFLREADIFQQRIFEESSATHRGFARLKVFSKEQREKGSFWHILLSQRQEVQRIREKILWLISKKVVLKKSGETNSSFATDLTPEEFVALVDDLLITHVRRMYQPSELPVGFMEASKRIMIFHPSSQTIRNVFQGIRGKWERPVSSKALELAGIKFTKAIQVNPSSGVPLVVQINDQLLDDTIGKKTGVPIFRFAHESKRTLSFQSPQDGFWEGKLYAGKYLLELSRFLGQHHGVLLILFEGVPGNFQTSPQKGLTAKNWGTLLKSFQFSNLHLVVGIKNPKTSGPGERTLLSFIKGLTHKGLPIDIFE